MPLIFFNLNFLQSSSHCKQNNFSFKKMSILNFNLNVCRACLKQPNESQLVEFQPENDIFKNFQSLINSDEVKNRLLFKLLVLQKKNCFFRLHRNYQLKLFVKNA